MKKIKSQSGQTMVEFILIFPLIMLFVFGIMQCVMLFKSKLVMHYAVYMAARSACVHAGQGNQAAQQSAITALSIQYPVISGENMTKFLLTDVQVHQNVDRTNVNLTTHEPLIFPLIDRLLGERRINRTSPETIVDPKTTFLLGRPTLPMSLSWSMKTETPPQ